MPVYMTKTNLRDINHKSDKIFDKKIKKIHGRKSFTFI